MDRYDSGVVLFDLNKLRTAKRWQNLLELVTETLLVENSVTKLTESDVMNAVVYNEPSIVHTLPCEWNVQSSNFMTKTCFKNIVKFKVDLLIQMCAWLYKIYLWQFFSWSLIGLDTLKKANIPISLIYISDFKHSMATCCVGQFFTASNRILLTNLKSTQKEILAKRCEVWVKSVSELTSTTLDLERSPVTRMT